MTAPLYNRPPIRAWGPGGAVEPPEFTSFRAVPAPLVPTPLAGGQPRILARRDRGGFRTGCLARPADIANQKEMERATPSPDPEEANARQEMATQLTLNLEA